MWTVVVIGIIINEHTFLWSEKHVDVYSIVSKLEVAMLAANTHSSDSIMAKSAFCSDSF